MTKTLIFFKYASIIPPGCENFNFSLSRFHAILKIRITAAAAFGGLRKELL
jgi:hypothetical protein